MGPGLKPQRHDAAHDFRSPLKKNKVKSARKHSDTSLPKSSTRLFQTNIDQTDTGPPDLSSIHGDAGQ